MQGAQIGAQGLVQATSGDANQAPLNPPSVRGEEIPFVPRPITARGFPIKNAVKPDEEDTKRFVLRYAVRSTGSTYMREVRTNDPKRCIPTQLMSPGNPERRLRWVGEWMSGCLDEWMGGWGLDGYGYVLCHSSPASSPQPKLPNLPTLTPVAHPTQRRTPTLVLRGCFACVPRSYKSQLPLHRLFPPLRQHPRPTKIIYYTPHALTL